MPGEQLIVENGQVRVERYWRFPVPEPGAAPEAEWSAALMEALEESSSCA